MHALPVYKFIQIAIPYEDDVVGKFIFSIAKDNSVSAISLSDLEQ